MIVINVKSNGNKEEFEKFHKDTNSALVGSPAFVNNEIIVSPIDEDGKSFTIIIGNESGKDLEFTMEMPAETKIYDASNKSMITEISGREIIWLDRHSGDMSLIAIYDEISRRFHMFKYKITHIPSPVGGNFGKAESKIYCGYIAKEGDEKVTVDNIKDILERNDKFNKLYLWGSFPNMFELPNFCSDSASHAYLNIKQQAKLYDVPDIIIDTFEKAIAVRNQ